MIHRRGLTRTFEVAIDSVPGDKETVNKAKELWETDKDKHRYYTINVALSAGDKDFLKEILDGSTKKSVFLSQSLAGTSFNPCSYIDMEVGNRIAVVAAKYGHLDIVEDMLKKGANNKHTVLACAARYGHSSIVHKIGRGMKLDNAVYNAAVGKHYELLVSLIRGRYVPYKATTHTACVLAEDGALRELNMIIRNGADNFNEMLYIAVEHKHKDIVEMAIEKGATNLDEVIIIAIEHGNRELIKLLIEKGANPEKLLSSSLMNHNTDILEDLCGKGNEEVDNEFIFIAASDGDLEKVEELCDCGFKNYLSVAVVAANSGSIDVVKAMVKRFSDDCEGDPERMKELVSAIVEAAEDHIDIADYARSLV